MAANPRPASAATLRSALQEAVAMLAPIHPTARLDAEVLLAHVLGAPRHRPYAWPEETLPEPAREHFGALLRRRARGEPVAYLTGTREFWSLALEVSPDTLIPRPETERLVEVALDLIPATGTWRIADLGTGSGAVALAIAQERPHCEIHAGDISPAALAVARRNATRLELGRVVFTQGNWCAALPELDFDLIVANPPYVAAGDAHLECGDVRFEPRLALCGGAGGLDAIRRIAHEAPQRLRRGGWLALEHGHEQGSAVRALLAGLDYGELATACDGSGHERVTIARVRSNRPGPTPGADACQARGQPRDYEDGGGAAGTL